MLTKQILEKRERVAEILTTARVQKGLSQDQLADMVGFGQKTIEKIEGCKYSPNADQLYALCAALGVEIRLNEAKI